jgi:antitoxin component of MazEF toxin-antitoxin module
MRIPLKRIGNSRGFTIPSTVLDRLGWTEQTVIEMELIEDGLVFRKGVPDLSELISSVTKGLPEHPIPSRQLRGTEPSK